jgi:prepilin-type N-terminal cleavage/methylation domain-containing protein
MRSLRARRKLVRRAPKGVTLLEMMVVVAIIGIVAAIAVPNLNPVIQEMRLGAAASETAALVDRARRLALNEGRCHMLIMSGNNIVIRRRDTPNCGHTGFGASNGNVDLDATNGWEAGDSGKLIPPDGISFEIEETSGVADTIIFRTSGRVVGDGDMRIDEDGGRILIFYPSLNKHMEVLVTSNGRTCTNKYKGVTANALSVPVFCGSAYSGTSGGSGGGGCSTLDADGVTPWLFLTALGFFFRGRRRARRSARVPSQRRRAQARGPRGYLLIEVMVSGAILAVILSATIGLVASSRAEITRASHRAKASSLAEQAIGQLLSEWPHTTTAACPGGITLPPGYSMTCNVTQSGLDGSSTPALFDADHLHNVTVTVTYPNIDGTGTDTTTHQALRRNRPF